MSDPKKKNVILIAAVVLVSLLVAGTFAVFWWMHTPYFAIQQIATSIAKKDSQTFYEYCDANNLVTLLTDELFLQPAMKTTGMSQFQNYVAAGAIVMTKTKMDNALIAGIERMVTPVPHTSYYHVFPQYSFPRNSDVINVYPSAFNRPPAKVVLIGDQINFGDFARTVGQELKKEQEDLKKLAAQRMQEYAAMHQDKLIGHFLAGSQQGSSMKGMLAEYGFQTSNFKTMYVHTVEDRQICTVEFFSPKVNHNVPISVELTPVTPGEIFSKYKVIRVWRIKETTASLNEDTDKQVQELVAYSLQDIAPQQVKERGGDLLKRITRNENTQKLWEQLKKSRF